LSSFQPLNPKFGIAKNIATEYSKSDNVVGRKVERSEQLGQHVAQPRRQLKRFG
jgi:hypothetical protein